MQDVDGKLKDFQEKQNIDIGLIMGRGNNNASLVSDKMPVLPRANIMRMGATRSLSVSKSVHDLPTASCAWVPHAARLSVGLRVLSQMHHAAAWLSGSTFVRRSGCCLQ